MLPLSRRLINFTRAGAKEAIILPSSRLKPVHASAALVNGADRRLCDIHRGAYFCIFDSPKTL